MDRVTLGRTGLSVSVAGLGCGGHSRLGTSYGASPEAAADVVRAAIDAGVNFIDTAAAYRTEEVVGQAIRGRRDQVVISTKQRISRPPHKPVGEMFLTAAEFTAKVDENLSRLGTDYIDIFHLHGVIAEEYPYCRDELVPALLKLQEQGKIRFLGLTERFASDTGHEMLDLALEDDLFDVIMVGFNMVNPSARERVLRRTMEKDVGTLIMFAVRRALGNPEVLREVVQGLVDSGEVDADAVDLNDPLGFLSQPGVAESVIEAAYRFCRHEPGAHVILTGTGSTDHLAQNLASIGKPPLPAEALERLERAFGRVDSVSCN